jgi:tetraspanin E
MENVDLNIPSTTATAMIIFGCALFVISFLGCYGAFSESYCMLTTYGVIIFVFLFLQLLLAGLLITYHDTVSGLTTNTIQVDNDYLYTFA